MRKIKFNKQKKEKTFNFGNLCAVKIDDLYKTKIFFVSRLDLLKLIDFQVLILIIKMTYNF